MFVCTRTTVQSRPGSNACTEQYQDNCPSNQNLYCLPIQQISSANGKIGTGFCCKKPAPKCPMGKEHNSSVAPNWGCDKCPYNTHYCHKNAEASSLGICCVKPCASPEDVYSGGKCYAKVSDGGACEVTAQCIGTEGMTCVDVAGKKICQCSDNKVPLNGKCQSECVPLH